MSFGTSIYDYLRIYSLCVFVCTGEPRMGVNPITIHYPSTLCLAAMLFMRV